MEQLKTTITDYGNGIYAFDQQMVRAFLIIGKNKALLLDTGAVPFDIISHIKNLTSLPLDVIVTHGDGDHIGNLGVFTDAFIHPSDMNAVLSHSNCKNVFLHPLAEGDVFDIGGRSLTVLFTPGHTAGSICLADKENKILFSSDTISRGPVFMFGERRNIPQYLITLRRLKQMEDNGAFSTIYSCHNTCPVSSGTLNDLIMCIEAIIDGSDKGIPAPMPIPGDEKPLIARYGLCSVLF